MITGITKNMHGFTDYTYIPLVAAAPHLAGFTDERKASRLCYALSGAVLGYSLLTDAKWGAVPLISYRTHSALDLSLGIAALAAAAVPSYAKTNASRNTLLLMGVTGLLVGTLSLIGARRVAR